MVLLHTQDHSHKPMEEISNSPTTVRWSLGCSRSILYTKRKATAPRNTLNRSTEANNTNNAPQEASKRRPSSYLQSHTVDRSTTLYRSRTQKDGRISKGVRLSGGQRDSPIPQLVQQEKTKGAGSSTCSIVTPPHTG